MSTPAPVQISVVCPMHNEELCVTEFVTRVGAALAAIGRPHEIIIVSDGSTDKTEAMLRDLCATHASLRAVFLSRNMGQCAALYAGIQHSHGEYVIVMDGDLQHLPEEIHLLVTEMDKGFDLVSGSRGKRNESLVLRRFPSMVANYLLRAVTNCPIRDMGGFKCIRGRLARKLRLCAGQHRLLPALIYLQGGSVSEVIVSAPPRFAGKSHYGISRSLDVLFDIMHLWFQASFKSRPLYMFGRVGVTFMLFDVLIMPKLLWDKFIHGESLSERPAFFIAIMMFLASLGFFAAGFILELLSDTLNTVSHTRPYVVREEVGGDASVKDGGHGQA